MKISEEAEELLEKIWTIVKENKEEYLPLNDASFRELEEAKYIEQVNGRWDFTSTGFERARNIIRRHRLTERLLKDVLGVNDELEMEESACKFEHVLSEEVEESICTLLGHPKFCPHENPIPPGKCCRENRKFVESVISPLSDLKSGDRGRIAYLLTQDKWKLQKILVMGLLPGAELELIQRYPTFVLQTGNTQVAIDENLAEIIYIRLMERKYETSSRKKVRKA